MLQPGAREASFSSRVPEKTTPVPWAASRRARNAHSLPSLLLVKTVRTRTKHQITRAAAAASALPTTTNNLMETMETNPKGMARTRVATALLTTTNDLLKTATCLSLTALYDPSVIQNVAPVKSASVADARTNVMASPVMMKMLAPTTTIVGKACVRVSR